MSIAPGHLMAGSMICTDYVFLFNDDDSSSYDNVQNILNIADAVQILYDNSSDFPCGNFMASTPELEPVEFSVFPNPSKGDITVQLANGSDPVIIEVRDMMGRLIHSEISQTASTQLHLNAPAGVYQVVVQSPHSKVAKSLVIQ
ncbi:T9SS type A sorting domain-containing protein [Crocinitomicaceae bacterium]|nr:T9SS type A sorting domain-containing protein [Crocinitomicaceae bacterium]